MLNRPQPMPSRLAAILSALVLFGGVAASPLAPSPSPTPAPAPTLPPTADGRTGPIALTILDRSVIQDQGSWQIDYRLRHDGKAPLVVAPSDIAARLEGWVSNSRVISHAVPRLSSIALSGAAGLTGTADLVSSADESQRCRERAILRIWTDAGPAPAPAHPLPASAMAPAEPAERAATLYLAPGAPFRARLRIEHQHFLYGDYDPLLGQRSVEIHLAGAVLRDALPIDRELYLAHAKFAWPAIPDDRRDTRQYVSAPDSLHLEAHVPGNQYYRFPERPVRYATKMRLRFWYLVAPGSEGECRVRVAQYKDTPTAWKVLSEGGFDHTLPKVGRWVKHEQIFRTEPDATTLALDFRICSGTDVGEMWIDDVSLEPVGIVADNP